MSLRPTSLTQDNPHYSKWRWPVQPTHSGNGTKEQPHTCGRPNWNQSLLLEMHALLHWFINGKKWEFEPVPSSWYTSFILFSVNRSMSVVVMDGITLGHPCCAISNCQEPLISSWDCYCQTHQNTNKVCAIIGCAEPVVVGFKTCKDPLHRTIEETHHIHGQARFQL